MANDRKDNTPELVLEGWPIPITFYLDELRRPILIKGYRRIAALHMLAERNIAAFPQDMPIAAVEHVDGNSERRPQQ